jgi:hypothetical protein
VSEEIVLTYKTYLFLDAVFEEVDAIFYAFCSGYSFSTVGRLFVVHCQCTNNRSVIVMLSVVCLEHFAFNSDLHSSN